MRDPDSPEFRRVAIDMTIQTGLGRFFAAHSAPVCFTRFISEVVTVPLPGGDSIESLRAQCLGQIGRGGKDAVVHDINYGQEYFMHGQWLDRLPAMDRDTADLEKLLEQSHADRTKAVSRK